MDGAAPTITATANRTSLVLSVNYGGANATAKQTGRRHMDSKQTLTLNSGEETLLSLLNDAADASLPYNGTSGWSGTDTSEERAIAADTSGDTSRRQRETIEHLFMAHKEGLTWRELSRITGWHHGQASGVLSVLHKDGKIARLLDRRNRCRIYVHLDHIGDRETDTQGRKPKACPNCGHAL